VITFVHTADWQIGKPFASIADPAKRARVQQERIEVVRRIGRVVRERRAAFVVVAGDLFDSPTPTNATVAAALGAIASIEVPVYCIPGNHDHGGPGSLWEQPFFTSEHRRLAPNFHVLLEPEPLIVDVPTAEGVPARAVLLPCPLRRRHEADDPTAWLRPLDFAPFGDLPRIVIAHGSTTVFASGSASFTPGSWVQADDEELDAASINTLALDRLPLAEIDHVALGDWHGFLAAGPKAFYSGAPEIDRFPKPGQRPGHVAIITAARGAEPRVEAVATGRFRWLVHSASLGDDGPGQLDDWLTEATRPVAVGEAGFDACLARLEVSGSVSLAERDELDQVVESWTARLLRFDIDDQTVLAPSADEIRELAERPGDPIIARVAGELVTRLAGSIEGPTATNSADNEPGEIAAADPDVVRHAIHLLHAIVAAADTASAANGGAAAIEPAASSPAIAPTNSSAEDSTP
jgi:hypothetical protein